MNKETLIKQSRVLVFRDEKPYTLKINGKPKTWKTRPDAIQIPYKYGLYEHGYIGNTDKCDVFLEEIHLDESPIKVQNTSYKVCPYCHAKHKYQYYYPQANHLIPFCRV